MELRSYKEPEDGGAIAPVAVVGFPQGPRVGMYGFRVWVGESERRNGTPAHSKRRAEPGHYRVLTWNVVKTLRDHPPVIISSLDTQCRGS